MSRSIRISRRARLLSISALGLASAAFAASTPRSIDPLSWRWWVTMALLHVVILIAYGAASLPKWANWIEGSRHDRFTIAQGVLISLVAGNVAWALSYYYANAHEAVSWVMAVLAAYSGDSYLRRQLERLIGRMPDPPAPDQPSASNDR